MSASSSQALVSILQGIDFRPFTLNAYRFLPERANAILGFDALDWDLSLSATDNGEAQRACEPLARAVAFGASWGELRLDPRRCSRDACYFLQRLDLVPACHALACLTRAIKGTPIRLEPLETEEISRFADEAVCHLDFTADLLGDEQLKWEVSVLRVIRSRDHQESSP